MSPSLSSGQYNSSARSFHLITESPQFFFQHIPMISLYCNNAGEFFTAVTGGKIRGTGSAISYDLGNLLQTLVANEMPVTVIE